MRIATCLFLALFALTATAEKPGPNNTGPHTTNPNDAYNNPNAPCNLDSSCPVDLTPYTGPKTITTDGQIYRHVTVSGKITLECSNCGFENSVFDGGYNLGPNADNGSLRGINAFEGTAGAGRTGRVVNYNEFRNYFGQAIYLQNGEANYNYVHQMGADSFNIGENVDVIGNWSEKLGYISGSHADIIQSVLGDNIRVLGNHFDCDFQGILKCSAAVLFQAANSSQDNILIEGNWINGGNNSVYVDKHTHLGPNFTLTNARVINNLFPADADGLGTCNGQPCGSGAGGTPRYAHIGGSDIAVKSCNRYESDLTFLNNFTQNTSNCPPPPTGVDPGPPPVYAATFSPSGTTYDTSIVVTLASATAGAEIRYTLDGTDPIASSTLYAGPLTLTTNVTVRAKVFDGGEESGITEQSYVLQVAGEYTSDSTWDKVAITQVGDGLVFEFDVRPNNASVNTVVGLDEVGGAAYASQAALIRLNPAGYYDVYDDNGYIAPTNTVNYVSGQVDRARITIPDVSLQRYDVEVQSDKTGAFVEIGSNLLFRYKTIGEIGFVNFVTLAGTGTTTLSGLDVDGTDPGAPEPNVPVVDDPLDATKDAFVATPLRDLPQLPNGTGLTRAIGVNIAGCLFDGLGYDVEIDVVGGSPLAKPTITGLVGLYAIPPQSDVTLSITESCDDATDTFLVPIGN